MAPRKPAANSATVAQPTATATVENPTETQPKVETSGEASNGALKVDPAMAKKVNPVVTKLSKLRDKNQQSGMMTDVRLIYPNPNQPRQLWDNSKKELDELALNISQQGLQSAIIVTPRDLPIVIRSVDEKGKLTETTTTGYMIVAGERRYRAFKTSDHLFNKALALLDECLKNPTGNSKLIRDLEDVLKVPCTIKTGMDDQTVQIQAITENMFRKDITPLEQARAYGYLAKQFGMTVEQICVQLGVKQKFRVEDRLALLNLSDELQQKIGTPELPLNAAMYAGRIAVENPKALDKYIKLTQEGHASSETAAKVLYKQLLKEKESDLVQQSEIPVEKEAVSQTTLNNIEKLTTFLKNVSEKTLTAAESEAYDDACYEMSVTQAKAAIEFIDSIMGNVTCIRKKLRERQAAAAVEEEIPTDDLDI